MRLLIAILEERKALEIRLRLYGMDERWDIGVAADGAQAALLLKTERWDALLLDSRLRAGGASLWETLCQAPPLCPPRVLALWQDGPRPAADCAVPAESGGARIAALLSVLAKKPLPYLAAAHRARIERAAERFLDALGMRREWKGRSYAAWCLCRRVPVPGLDQQPVNRLYAGCARAFGVSAGAVERCLRVAVEGVFTMGSIPNIERFFGATIDPDKGKPTNRAFLMEAVGQLRLLLDGGMLGKEQGDAPQPCRAYQRIDDAAPDCRLTAEDPCHQIKLEYADQRPVDRADDDQHQCDCVYHRVSSFLQARGLFHEFAPEKEGLCSSGRKQA